MITLLLLARATYISMGVVLHAHPVRGGPRIQRKADGEVATIILVCVDGGQQQNYGGGLSVSAIFCSKFQRGSRQVFSLSPTIPTVLTTRRSPPLSVVRCTKRMLSQKLSALKPKGSIGDEHSIVKRKTLSNKECRNELLGSVANIAVFPRIRACFL